LKVTKVVIRIFKFKKDRKHNDQAKKDKRQTTIYKTLHRKLKIKQHEPYETPVFDDCILHFVSNRKIKQRLYVKVKILWWNLDTVCKYLMIFQMIYQPTQHGCQQNL